MTNTKARHKEILHAAKVILDAHGGVETIDALSQEDRIPVLRQMAEGVITLTDCTMSAARSNVAKAMRRARLSIMQQDNWGGARPGAGSPLPEDQKRKSATARFAPGTVDLAKKIATVQGMAGWSRAIDAAISRWAKDLGIE